MTATSAGSTAGRTATAVEIRGLTVRRRGNLVLDGLDLDIQRGLITGLVGPSGGGKSTLMRAIVGVQQFISGNVLLFGAPAGSPVARKSVGYMTQSSSIYEDLTVQENVTYFAKILGAAPAEAQRVLDVVELTSEAHALAGSLSGGQRARVSLACAMLGNPRLLVLDEPTVGLDPVLRQYLWAAFRSLAHDGATLIVSSHVMDEAQRCDQLVLMREGTVLADEPPRDLVERVGATDVEDAFLKLVRQRESE